MSEDGFHVHGAHEHAVEHHAEGGDGLGGYVAIFTAILATVGAIISYQGGATQNEAMLFKNEAVLKKAQASDQWNFYQAKSSKGHLMELAAEFAPAHRQEYFKIWSESTIRKRQRLKPRPSNWKQSQRKRMRQANMQCTRTTNWHRP